MTAKILRDQFEQRLKDLQNICSHTEVSPWVDYMWAPGHMGLPVKICLCCEKIIETMKSETHMGLVNPNWSKSTLRFDDDK